MNQKLSFLSACLAATALLGACKKNTEPGGTPEPAGGYTTLEALYQTQTSQPLSFNINSERETRLQGAFGVQYEIPDSAFMLLDSTPVYGTITIVLKEYVSKKDMIFHRILPRTDTSVLESYGMVHIQANKNGAPLMLKSGEKIAAYLPQHVNVAIDAEMKLFTGVASAAGDFSSVTWKEAPEEVGDALPLLTHVVLYSSKLGYLQAANYQQGNKHKVSLNLSGFPDFDQSAMLRTYVLYDNLKTTYGMGQTPFGYRSGATVVDSFISNQPLHLVSFGIKDGFFYGGIKEATVSSDTTLSLELTKMEAVDLFSQVAALK